MSIRIPLSARWYESFAEELAPYVTSVEHPEGSLSVYLTFKDAETYAKAKREVFEIGVVEFQDLGLLNDWELRATDYAMLWAERGESFLGCERTRPTQRLHNVRWLFVAASAL